MPNRCVLRRLLALKNFIIFCFVFCPLPRELFCEEREEEEEKRNLHIHNNNNISHFEKKMKNPLGMIINFRN